LRAGYRNTLVVTAFSGTGSQSTTLPVVQSLAGAAGTASGRVLDAVNRAPLAGVRVAYGPRYAVTGADGRYTLAGLPDGVVAVTAGASGRLAGVPLAPVQARAGTAPDLLLQKAAAPVRVGAAGGSFSGPGWRVEVPAGAVYRPTDLSLTSLESSG